MIVSQEEIVKLTPSSNQRGVIAVNQATMLVLWHLSLNFLKYYIDLSKSLVTINQIMIQQILEEQTPPPHTLPHENLQDLDANPSQVLTSKLSLLATEMGLPEDNNRLISSMHDFMGIDPSTNPVVRFTQDMTIITLWNYTLDRLKNYIDLVDALKRLNSELLIALEAPIVFTAQDLKNLKFDIQNLPGFLRKCFEGACNFISLGRLGRDATQFDQNVTEQRDQQLAAIGQKIVEILARNNPGMRKKAMTRWLQSAQKLSPYLDVVQSYINRAIKQEPDADAERLLILIQQLIQQDEEERRHHQESSSDDSRDNSDIRPDTTNVGKDDHESPSMNTASPTEPSESDSSYMGETISRGFEGPGWSSMDERAFQAGDQFDQDMPSGREITR
ncbi:MAG: hypothetical protein KF798_06915 [Candidatus Paracaedibacteraceae bacterium]|nr:hypothetical protein [Candidatus Paracaedibacteraceae bacterium]